MIKHLTKLFKEHQIESVVIFLILLISAILRFYRIGDYMTFLGDEGRDALVIKGILIDHHIPLLGPPTSVGNMYLGPLYYYMMALPMTIFWLNPVAAAGMVAVIGVATVGLVYYLVKKWIGIEAAVIASILYSVSPVNLFYSRSSWQPDPAPFFALLAIIGMMKLHETKNYRWFILTAVALAAVIQMHYLALLMLPIIGVIWSFEFYINKKYKTKVKDFGLGHVWGIVLFLLLISPLFIFDIRHNFLNTRAFIAFFSNRGTTVNLNIFNTLGRIWPIFSDILVKDYMVGNIPLLQLFVSLLVIFSLVIGLIVSRSKRKLLWIFGVLGVWLVIGILGLSLYKQTIYDHYLGFLNPVPFILIGALTTVRWLIKNKPLKQIYTLLLYFLVVILAILSLQRSPLSQPPNNELKRTQDISHFISNQSNNQPFNFALLSEHNYDAAYQFYLGLYGHSPLKVPFSITSQLFVVCEDPVCQPINNPKYEIAAFGWSKIVYEKDFEGVKVFKLIHNYPQK